jgi:hypothetical protein
VLQVGQLLELNRDAQSKKNKKAWHLSLSWTIPVHAFPYHFLKIHFNIILPFTSRSCKQSFPPRCFPPKTLYALRVSSMLANKTGNVRISNLNILKTKRNLLHIRNQSVPRCKHFPPRMMYKAKAAVCSQIRTKHSTQSEHHVEFLKVKNQVARKETARLLKVMLWPVRVFRVSNWRIVGPLLCK